MPASSSSFLTDYDFYLFNEGTHYRSWDKMGAHPGSKGGKKGTWFSVWAPNAEKVSVIGTFNNWNEGGHFLDSMGDSGIWSGFIPGVRHGDLYKYVIVSRYNNFRCEKSDPYAFACEIRPQTASIVWDLGGYDWGDSDWMADRHRRNSLQAPISIYEVHLGSWMRGGSHGEHWLSYRELAGKLAAYVTEMGFTHVELMPITEHPLDASWGYQTVGYYAPTSRFGTPRDFMFFVDTLHQQGIGVILDWVPAHFPKDGHGLGYFDGTHLYEHADPKQREHTDWGTFIFNYGRHEVSNFLIANALFWLAEYHIDGLRVDAVASMLYLDYSRQDGEWVPNKYGGRDNLEAREFIQHFNHVVYQEFPDTMTIAEESTDWPMVSGPTYVGGLGFGLKWNMGWMHDSLLYMQKDPIHRKYYHNNLTFSLFYAFSENFLLPFSHDEVVHGKGSMIGRMAGDIWQKFANLRLLYGYMFSHPGKKLLFMGDEFGQWAEWNHDASLDWHLVEFPIHRGLQTWVRDLNRLLASEPALHEIDFAPQGFQWIDCQDYEQSIIIFRRSGKNNHDDVVCVCNFTPVPRENYRIGVPAGGSWCELLNSDAAIYGGSGMGNMGMVGARNFFCHGQPYSLSLTLPPLAILILRQDKKQSLSV